MLKRKKWIVLMLLLSLSFLYTKEGSMEGTDTFEILHLEKDGEASVYGRQRVHWVDKNGKTVELNMKEEENTKNVKGAEDLPESYDLRTQLQVTSAKNQGNSGTCWAFGGLGSLESNLIKQEVESYDDIDLSELHTVWFSYKPTTNKEDSTYGDGDDLTPEQLFKIGGTYRLFASTLGRGSGAIDEEEAPFINSASQSSISNFDEMAADMEAKESLRYLSEYRLRQANVLDDAGTDAIKNKLMNVGALEVSYYSKASSAKEYHDFGDGVAYYQDAVTNEETDNSNHTVLLVGWDDTFSKKNFHSSCRPKKDGAWLIRNSWGEEFGEDGYFWISYEEPTLTEFVSMEGEIADSYDTIYQYDGYDIWYSVKSKTDITAANVYTANYDEKIESVGFYTESDNAEYKISIYKNLKGNSPDSGTLALEFEGVQPYTGYHTVNLPEKVSLLEGETYAIAITYKINEKGYAVLPMEGDLEKWYEEESAYASKPGQSFLFLNQEWMDTTEGYMCEKTGKMAKEDWAHQAVCGYDHEINNIPIKAFTTFDTARLMQICEEAEKIDTTLCYEDTVSGFEEILQSAKEILENTDATGKEISSARVALENALKKVRYISEITLEKEGETISVYWQGTGKEDADLGTVTLYAYTMSDKTEKVIETKAASLTEGKERWITYEIPPVTLGADMYYAVYSAKDSYHDSNISQVYVNTKMVEREESVEVNSIPEVILPVNGKIEGISFEITWENQTLEDIVAEKVFNLTGVITFTNAKNIRTPEKVIADLQIGTNDEKLLADITAKATEGVVGTKVSGGLYIGEEAVLEHLYTCYYSGTSDDGTESLANSTVPPTKAGTYQVLYVYETCSSKGEFISTLVLKEKVVSVNPLIGVKKEILTIPVKKLVLGKGEKYKLNKIVITNSPSFSYTSNDKKVAKVTKKGLIKAKKTGSCKVTVTAAAGTKATIKIVVKKAPKKIVLKKHITVLKKGKTMQIKIKKLVPKKSASETITYKSSKKKVATIDENGKIVAKKKGKTKITVSTYNKKKTSFTLRVK